MWRRFAGGSAKRKCGVLEIEDGEEEITGSWRGTAAPNTSTPVSSRERTEVESTKGSSRAMAVPNKPPTVSRKGEESPLTTGTASARTTAVPNKPPAVFRKQEESPSTGTGSSRTMAVPSTPISSRRRTLPGVVATPPPAVSSFRRFSSPFSGKRSHSGSPIVVKEEIPSQLSNLARAPSVKRGNSSCYSIFSSPMTLKREPTEPDDDYQIESQAGSPEKQVSAEEGIIEHEESVLSQWSQHNERFTIARTQDLPSSPSFPVERPTVTQPNVSPKKKRRKFHGFAGRLASHLTAARAERVLSRRDPNVETMEVLIKKTVRCWGVTSSFLSSGHQLFSRRNEPVPSKGPASAVQGPAPLRRRLVLPLAQLAIHPRRPPALLHPVFSLVPDGIHEQKLRKAKCQCSTQKGPVPCYNNWCEIGFSGDKEGACALVTSGRIRHFACVRVNKGSADQCMVDKKDGKEVTRCWCKSGDYCNVDLADRVEEDNEFPVSAEEIATTTTTQLPVIVEKDDFVIDAAYDSGTSDVNYDDDDLSWEEDLPIERHIPPAPPRPTPPPGPTLPPWRREYASGGQPAPPPRPPPLPDVRERALPQPRLPPPPRVEEHRVEPTTSSTTTTTTRSTATVPPTTVSTTASTTTPSTTSTQRTTPTTASEAPTTKINAYAFWKKNKEEAARLYKLQKQRYRPMDLFAQKTSSISSTPSTTESTSASTTTESTSTSTSTSTTTSTSTSTTTTTTASTTTEEVTTITEKPTTSVVTTPSTTVTTPSSTLVSTTEKSTTTTEEARKSAEEEKMFRPRLRSTAGGISVFVAILVAMIL